LAAGVLIWITGWYGINRQQRNIATAIAGFWTFVLLLVWFAITAKRAWGVALVRAARFWSRAPSRSLDQEKADLVRNQS
jgi:hypothetical protein